ncbi:MAG TPA: redoxin family protein [Mycobacteriales bacterium]|nr:redoxin family protein [Mycobacteriales bacterium]
MSVLAAAVAVLTVVTLVNLLLLLGVVRRLRATAVPARAADPFGLSDAEPLVLPAGSPLPDVTLPGADGTPLRLRGLADRRVLLAFLSQGCGSCHLELPRVRDLAARAAADGAAVVVVVLTEQGDPELEEPFAGIATVTRDGLLGPLSREFGITSFPSYLVFERDALTGSAFTVDRVAWGAHA